jgi:hypothetical protein
MNEQTFEMTAGFEPLKVNLRSLVAHLLAIDPRTL